MKHSPLKIGMASLVLPIPLLLLTSFWAFVCTWVIGIGLLHYDPGALPLWIDICSFLPLLLSPTLSVWGVVCGVRRRQEKHARMGMVLSVFGLLENAFLIYGLYYMGSRF